MLHVTNSFIYHILQLISIFSVRIYPESAYIVPEKFQQPYYVGIGIMVNIVKLRVLRSSASILSRSIC